MDTVKFTSNRRTQLIQKLAEVIKLDDQSSPIIMSLVDVSKGVSLDKKLKVASYKEINILCLRKKIMSFK